MEKKVQGREFVCKHCQQRCLSGKSLGGHMRRHLPLNSAAAAKDNNKAKAESDDMNCEIDGADDDILGKFEENGCCICKVSAEQQSQQPQTNLIQEKMEELMSVGIGSDDQDQDSYDLRENPKKSWKISDVGAGAGAGDSAAAYLCKECEKSFPSSRALAGHMRAHTVKGKKNLHICKKCSKGFESVRAMYGHMKSHSKRRRLSSTTKSEFGVDYPRKKRSVIRYKLAPNPSPSSSNAAFGFVDEVEDAAMCLMMLSRDLDSLDNAVELELESKSFQSQSREFSVTSADEEKNPPPEKKMDSSRSLVSEINEFDSEFGSHNNDARKDAEIELEDDTKIAKASSDSDSTQVEPPPEKDLRLAALGTDQDDSELVLHSDPVEKKSLVEDPVDVGSEMFKDVAGKKRGYKCRTCNMIFSSHQALGGHRNRHKIIINSSSSSSSNSNSSSSAVMNEHCNYYNGAQNQKGKDHECAVCFKVFPTGQALGGHKRAHYAGFTESRTKENTVGRNDHELQQILDLNHQTASQSSHHQQESTESELGDITLWWGPEHGGHSSEPLLLSLSLIEKTNSNS